MWLAILKIALVVFLVVGVGIVLVIFIRKSRAQGFPTPESSSHFWQAEGAMPPTPKPEWDNWDQAGDDDADGDQRRRSKR
jgi:L-asparagine transporter-like permease